MKQRKETPAQYRARKFANALDYASKAPEGITGNRQMAAALVKAIKKQEN